MVVPPGVLRFQAEDSQPRLAPGEWSEGLGLKPMSNRPSHRTGILTCMT